MAVFNRNSLVDNQIGGGLHLRSRRGQIGENWWSRRFIETIEAAADPQILEAGRRLARKSQVVRLTVESGRLSAEVYENKELRSEVLLEMPVVPNPVWEQFISLAVQDCVLLAQLFAGTLPKEMEDRIHTLGSHLFEDSVRHFTCSCMGTQCPCTHIIAAACVFAEQMDLDPFAYIAFRGLDRQAFANAVRRCWGGQEIRRREQEIVSLLPSLVQCFYSCPKELPADNALLKLPEVHVLKRLGRPPFLPPADQSMIETLRDLYVD